MKTLVIGLNWLGDVVMSFPALAAAAREAGGAVEVLTRPHLADLYRLHPDVGKTWVVETKRPLWSMIPEWLRLRRRRYGTIWVLPRSFRSALVAFLVGGCRRIGYSGEGRDWLLHARPPLPPAVETIHESRLHVALIGSRHQSLPEAALRLPSEEELGRVAAKFSLPPLGPFWLVAPGAAFGPAKRWPEDRFAALCGRISREKGLGLVATGSAKERPLTAVIPAVCGGKGLDLGGQTNLRELICLVSLAEGVIANDSGTMHLGALLGKPVVVPIGSTDPVRTGPLGSRAVLVRGEACRPPCRKPVCPLGTNRCMESVTVDAMFQAFEQALRLPPAVRGVLPELP